MLYELVFVGIVILSELVFVDFHPGIKNSTWVFALRTSIGGYCYTLRTGICEISILVYSTWVFVLYKLVFVGNVILYELVFVRFPSWYHKTPQTPCW